MSLLELALTLPLLVLLVSGTLDLAHYFREEQALHAAVRQAVRVAADYIARDGQFAENQPGNVENLSDPDDPGGYRLKYRLSHTPLPDCGDGSKADYVSARRIGPIAKLTACESLLSAGLDPNDWTIEVETVALDLGTGFVWQELFRVRISPKEQSRSCLVCWGSLWDSLGITPQAETAVVMKRTGLLGIRFDI